MNQNKVNLQWGKFLFESRLKSDYINQNSDRDNHTERKDWLNMT